MKFLSDLDRLVAAVETLATEVPTPDEKASGAAKAAEKARKDRQDAEEARILKKDKEALARIAALTATQRSSWFWFYGIFAFAAFTLMGTGDADFFTFSATTKLPVLNYDVNLLQFMTLGPLIILLVHIYMHVQLELLWRDLSKLRHEIDGDTLSTLTPAWLLVEAALYMRTWRRPGIPGEAKIVDKTWFGKLGVAATILLVWGGAPGSIGFFWLRSFVLHDLPLALGLGIALWVSIAVSLWSFWRFATALDVPKADEAAPEAGPHPVLPARLSRHFPQAVQAQMAQVGSRRPVVPDLGKINALRRPAPAAGLNGLGAWLAVGGALALLVIAPLTVLRTTGGFWGHGTDLVTAAQANLTGKALATKPADWRPRFTARRIYFSDWCKRYDTPACPETIAAARPLLDSAAFGDEFDDLRRDYISALPTTSFAGRDLTGAQMADVFGPGVSFAGATLTGAVLDRALLEGAALTDITLTGASFVDAKLPAARITGTTLSHVDFSTANLSGAMIEVEHLRDMRFIRADLSYATLRGSFTGSFSDGLFAATALSGVTFAHADLSAASLIRSHIAAPVNPAALDQTRFFGARGKMVELSGSALQHLDFTGIVGAERRSPADWAKLLRNSFGDGSVILPAGVARPCQWLKTTETTESDFIGTWRAWLEKGRQPWPPYSGMIDATDIRRIAPMATDLPDTAGMDAAMLQIPALPQNIPAACVWQ